MSQQLSIDAGLVKASDNQTRTRTFVPWVLLLGCAIIAVVVLMADASLTPEQRIDAFLQSGTYP